MAGFRHVLEQGRADLVVTLDSTGQHDATQIPHLIDQLLTAVVTPNRLSAIAPAAAIRLGDRFTGTRGTYLGVPMDGFLTDLLGRAPASTGGVAVWRDASVAPA